jgi:hypothetical protein
VTWISLLYPGAFSQNGEMMHQSKLVIAGHSVCSF